MTKEARIIGHIERIETGEGFLFVSGWVATEDRGPLDARLTLTVNDSAAIVVPELIHREDLNRNGVASGHAGFAAVLPLEHYESTQLRVSAIADGFLRYDFRLSETVISPFAPLGAIDQVGAGRLRGWVFDPSLQLTNSAPTLTIDSAVECTLTANEARPDLPYALVAGSQPVGFNLPFTEIERVQAGTSGPYLFDGRKHRFRLLSHGKVVASSDSELPKRPPSKSTREDSPSAPSVKRNSGSGKEPARNSASDSLKARLERVIRTKSHLVLVGWIANSDNSKIDSSVKFSIGTDESVVVGELGIRNDVKASGIAQGYAGYKVLFELASDAPFPTELHINADGKNTVLRIDPRKTTDAYIYGSLRGENQSSIAGSFIRIDDRKLPTTATILIDDTYKLSVPLESEAKDALWCVAGPVRSTFRLSYRAILQQLRGQHPSISFGSKHRFKFKLMSDESPIAVAEFSLLKEHKGRLEVVRADRVSGWLVGVEKNSPEAQLDVYIDDVRYATLAAKGYREDLVKKGLAKKGGGFRFELSNPRTDTADIEIAVKHAYSTEKLEGASGTLKLQAAEIPLYGSLLSNLSRNKDRGISIIVPIYNAADDLELCLESLVRNTSYPARLLLINDCSPDPRIRTILKGCEPLPNVEVYHNDLNMGFTKTVNRGISLAKDDDVVFLNSDTIVTPGWLQGLRAAAYSDLRVATATAVSNNAGAFNVPEIGVDNFFPKGFDVDAFSRLVRRVALPAYPKVPTGNGFCLYVRRDCLNEIGPLDEEAFPVGYGEENDFCMRALRAGFHHVIDDRTFIYHKRSASFGDAKGDHYAKGRQVIDTRYPEYRNLTTCFDTAHDLLAMRWRVRRAVQESNLNYTRPRIAYVISTQTGGTPQTNRDLMAAISDRYEPWVIRCDSKNIEVYQYSSEGDHLVEVVCLRNPIQPAIHRSAEYNDRIANILVRYGFEFVHIRHLGWHGADLPEVCEILGIPVSMSLHDFYTVCPSIKLLDENRTFCSGRCTQTLGDCAVELWDPSQFPPLKGKFIHRWREIFSKAFRHCDSLVTTATSAKSLVVSSYPELEQKDFRVIPHGRSFEENTISCSFPSAHKPIRVLVPGNVSPAKGAELIAEVVKLDSRRQIEFHILGDAGKLEGVDGIHVHGRYKRDDFGRIVHGIRPTVGAVLSIWPETYCHTLTEMWSCGVPVVGIDVGAVGERIRQHGGGWLLSLPTTASEVYELLLGIKGSAAEHRAKVNEVIDWQSGYGRTYNTQYMALKYDKMYREVWRRHLPFCCSDNAAAPAEIALVTLGEDVEKPNTSSDVVFWRVGPDWSVLADDVAEIDGILIRTSEPSSETHARIVSIAKERGLPVHVELDCRLSDVVHHGSLSWLQEASAVYVRDNATADAVQQFKATVSIRATGSLWTAACFRSVRRDAAGSDAPAQQ